MLPEESLPIAGERVSFERERGVSAIVVSPEVAYLSVRPPADNDPVQVRQQILRALDQANISIFLIKLQRNGLSFGVHAEDMHAACQTLESAGFRVSVKPRRRMVSIFAQNMRELHGVLAKTAEVLNDAGVALEQISDAHNRLTCLIDAGHAHEVVNRLRRAFHLREDAVRWVEHASTKR